MIAKIPTSYNTFMDILDAAFEQTKKECELVNGTIDDNYEEYIKLVDTLETTLRLWRALDDNHDAGDDIIIEIHPGNTKPE